MLFVCFLNLYLIYVKSTHGRRSSKQKNDINNPYYKTQAERGLYIQVKSKAYKNKFVWKFNPNHEAFKYIKNKDNKNKHCKYYKTLSENGKWWRFYGGKWLEKGSKHALRHNVWPSKFIRLIQLCIQHYYSFVTNFF